MTESLIALGIVLVLVLMFIAVAHFMPETTRTLRNESSTIIQNITKVVSSCDCSAQYEAGREDILSQIKTQCSGKKELLVDCARFR
jgi:hypothetical protein